MTTLLLINTGGTIGMTEQAGGLAPDEKVIEQYLHAHQSTWPHTHITLQTLSPLIDSSDLDVNHINTFQSILATHWQHYDGFIILHGTDTMAYSCALLAHALTGASKPIIYTGSQRPIHANASDAPRNLTFAISMACETAVQGVFLAFNDSLFPAGFFSKINAQANAAFAGQEVSPSTLRKKTLVAPFEITPLILKPTIHVVSLFPGMRYLDLPTATSENDVYIIRSFGAGNLPWQQADFNTFYTRNQHAIFINLSQCQTGVPTHSPYASGKLNARWISAGNATFEAVIAVLMVEFQKQQGQFDFDVLSTQLKQYEA